MAKIKNISTTAENKLKKALAPHEYEIKEQNTKSATLIIRAPGKDRSTVKTTVEKQLKTAGYVVTKLAAGGSIGTTSIIVNEYQVKINYKPISGGMSETTLNSTITELAPAYAFMANKKFTSVDTFYDFLKKSVKERKDYGVYVNAGDKTSGTSYIGTFPSSSKYKEKMENAMAVTKYLHDLNAKSTISQVIWGYRAKPTGIDAAHKGDLFVKFATGKWLGVSLKAGSEKSAEPQLNTYVNKLFDDFGRISDKEILKKKVHTAVHKKLDLPMDWESRKNKVESIQIIESFKQQKNTEYEKLYDKMLEICRDSVIEAINKSKKDTIAYLYKQVLKKDENVPLVVVKAYGKDYKMVTDEDVLEGFIPKTTKIVASKSASSKQEWYIDLKAKGETLRMKMTIRTNKSPPDNKIGQGFNLSIKFNGTVMM